MLSVDGTFFVLFFSFLVFMLLMKGLFFDPIMAIKGERETIIDEGRRSAEQAADKTQQLTRDYQTQLAEARRKAQQVVQEKREVAKAQAQKIVSEAREKALAQLDAQTSQLASTKESVYSTLAGQREGFVQSIVEKVAGGSRQAFTAGASQ